MHHFAYLDGALHAEGVSLSQIAGEVGTPVYVYSSATLVRHARVFRESLAPLSPKLFYAMKANGNLGVLMTLAREGYGADVVSEGEIRKALAAGIAPEAIVFSGIGKTEAELRFAVRAGLYQINVESEGELELLARIAAEEGRKPSIVLRVNPEIGAGGHAKITTGGAANKFGVSFADALRLYARATTLSSLAIKGFAVHIGSQITEFDALEAAFARLRGLVEAVRAEGFPASRLDLGGGVGIPYRLEAPYHHGPEILEAYAAMIARVMAGIEIELAFEPGRVIVGNAAVLLSRVLYVNRRADRVFLVLDAAMNDLVRPAMYDAYHEIWPVRASPPGAAQSAYDVVGPICESGDSFAIGRMLPELSPGDLVAFQSVGAYGAAMASTYNQRPLVPEVLVRGSEWALTRPRQSYAELIGLDRMPIWFQPGA